MAPLDDEFTLPPSRLPAAQIVDRKTVYDAFVTLDVLVLETTVRGKTVRLKREIHDHGHGAAVLAFDRAARTAILVRQIRPAALVLGEDPFVAEVIAGLVDDGEDPQETARREAMEEAGVTLGKLISVGSAFVSPGAVTERIHLFLGEIETRSTEGVGGLVEEHEEIEILHVSLGTLAGLADAGGIRDMKTLLLIETLRRREPELFA